MSDMTEMPQTKQSKLKAITLGNERIQLWNCIYCKPCSHPPTLFFPSTLSPFFSPWTGDTTTVGFGGVLTKMKKGGGEAPEAGEPLA
jgi:hypothetical protein